MVVFLRSRLPPEHILPSVRSAVWSLDRNLPLDGIHALDEVVETSTEKPRTRMLFLNGFAAFALLLAAIGLYGVVSFWVNARRRDIGIRLALGAQPSEVIAAIVRRGLILGALGIACGLGASLFVVRALSGLLFQVTPMDPLTRILVTLVVIAVSALASYIPARRASR
jgi:ABC-type antimicrobial peptide transport system permease subunit